MTAGGTRGMGQTGPQRRKSLPADRTPARVTRRPARMHGYPSSTTPAASGIFFPRRVYYLFCLVSVGVPGVWWVWRAEGGRGGVVAVVCVVVGR